MFSVCPHLGGTPSPSPSHNASTGPMSFPRGTPSPSHNTSTGPMSFLGGTPVTGLSNWFPPIMGWGNSLPRSGTRGRGTLVRSGWGYPWVPPCPGMDYPPIPVLSTWYAAVGMPLAFTQEDFLVLKSIVWNCQFGPVTKFVKQNVSLRGFQMVSDWNCTMIVNKIIFCNILKCSGKSEILGIL